MALGTEAIAARFASRFEACGDSPEALEWGSPEAQQRRFEVLADVGLVDGDVVADVGCGLGHLAEFLYGWGWRGRYVGIDVCPELVAAARARLQLTAGRLAEIEEGAGRASGIDVEVVQGEAGHLGVSPGSYDVVVASGLFYLGTYAAMMRTIEGLWTAARRAVAFNTLHVDLGAPAVEQLQVDEMDLIQIANRLEARWVLRRDYAPHDMTMYLFRRHDAGPNWAPSSWGRPEQNGTMQ